MTASAHSVATSNLVVVAMSGGVDSSVAALLLHQQGYRVLGVSMQVWDYRNHGGSSSRATCCAPDDFTDARRVAGKIGVPYYVFDFEKTFRREVIDNFVATYQRGETPNPCIDCNSKVKFRELRTRAAAIGAAAVATGHYAQVEERRGAYHLLRGVDPLKDQSYFLYNLNQTELGQTLFPVGAMKKDQVREIAREAGLVTAEKPESQDICFVSGSAADFVTAIGRTPARPGAITTVDGTQVGGHEGVHRFTVGQRRGLRVGGSDVPLYVVRIEPERNEVVVGPRSALETRTFQVSAANWCSPDAPKVGETINACVQVRHRHPGIPSRVSRSSQDEFSVEFTDAWTTVSPGQAAVVYDHSNCEVLGGGRILRSM
jgi:tRNA-specific 2-thiouridylase